LPGNALCDVERRLLDLEFRAPLLHRSKAFARRHGLVAIAGIVAGVALITGSSANASSPSSTARSGAPLAAAHRHRQAAHHRTENRAFGVWSSLFARRRRPTSERKSQHPVGVFQASFPIFCSIALFWLLAGAGGSKLSTGQFLAFSASFSMFLGAMLNVIVTGLHALSVIPMYERAKPILIEPVESQGSGDVRIELEAPSR